MLLKDILSGPMVERIGWTLIHLLWQAVALAAILAVVLVFMRKSRANIRYLAACSALVLMVLAPCVTIFMVPVSESGFEGFADTAGVPLDLAAAPMEPVEVLAPVEIEPIAAADVTTPIVPAGPSYSWKEQASMLFEPALPYLVLGWLAGVFGLSVWHLGGWAQLQRLRRRMVKQVGSPWNERVGELAERLGVRRAVELVESALVRVPTVVGWLRPVILLPASALTGLTGEQLQAILAHELAHIKRFDYLVNMLQTAVEILGFYHPAVWWVSHRIRVERENCCDDLAVSACGDRLRYARALACLEESRGSRPELAVAADGGSLLDRIRRLVGASSRENKRCGWVPAVVALLLILALGIPATVGLSSRVDKSTDVRAEGRGRLGADSLGNVLPAGWQLDYDSGRIPGEGRSWRSGMASDLAELRVVPRPVDPFDLSWKNEGYDFRISSLQGEEMGVIGVAGEIGDAHLTLRPDMYLAEYTRGRGKNPDNFKMRCGKLLVDLSRPGMYKLKFSPKLGSAEIAGSLDDCYALNFEKIGAGPRIDGLVYQHPPKQYLLDGLPPGKYRLNGVRQRQGDNVFVSHAEVTVKDGERAIADMDAAALGTCSLHGKILGKLSKPRADLRGEFQWFVLIRKPDSPPITTADAYEALTMDTIYVVRGQNIVRETEGQARYYLEEMAPGKYTATVIEHDLWGGAFITRQQSKPLTIKANEEAVLDFDLEGTENQSGLLSIRAASATESQFVATLANGVTVELVGVCRDPMKKGQQWWRPNGLEMAEPEYETHGNESLPFPCYGYLLRFTPFENISVRTEAGTEAFHNTGPVTTNGQCIAYAGFGEAHDVREIPDRAIVTVAAACAQWKEKEPSGNDVFPDSVNLSDGHTILISGLRENTEPRLPGGTLIEATTNLKDVEVRLDYVLEDGTRHEAGWDERKSVGWGKMIQYTFDIADRPESIKKIIVKYRLFETVQFKNVSLKPGVETNVQIEVGSVSPEMERMRRRPERAERGLTDRETRRNVISAKLAALQDHRRRVEGDMHAAEQALQEVRNRWGIIDLEDSSGRAFQHTITLRLNSLTLERDRCVLERRQLEATIKNLEERADSPDGKARLQQTQEELAVLASKLEQLEQMRQEVEAQQRELDSARIQYGQRLVIREERQERLDAIKEQIEKLKIIHDDPDVDEVARGFYERVTAARAEGLDRRLSRQEIAAKLASIEDRRRRIEVELRVAEEAMQEVRTRYGFTDLEDRSYPHPVTQRLIRLERQRDECALEIAQLQAQIGNLQEQADTPQGKANLKKAQEELVVLSEKLQALQEMSEQAEAKKRDLDAARVQHKQRAAIRDERKRMLESIKADIEKWKILHDDPQTPETPPVPEGR